MSLVCVYCKYSGSLFDFEIDHIIPVSRGGSDLPQNKQLICSGCNREKGDKTSQEYIFFRLTKALSGINPNFGPVRDNK